MSAIFVKKPLFLSATGRRKRSFARVWMVLKEGNGSLKVNQKPGELYLQYNSQYINSLKIPLVVFGFENDYDIIVKTGGGGLRSQSDAIKLGIAKALCQISAESRSALKCRGLLTRDSRRKERKKYGLRKARKAPQFSKR
jgi:small subunit ribosomal protein S9